MTKELFVKQHSFAKGVRKKDNSIYWASEDLTISEEHKKKLTKIIPENIDYNVFFHELDELIITEQSKDILTQTNRGIKVKKQLVSVRQNLLKSIDSIEQLDSIATNKLSQALLHVKRDLYLEEIGANSSNEVKDNTDLKSSLLKMKKQNMMLKEEGLHLKDNSSELIDAGNSLLLLIDATTRAMSTFKKNSRDNQHLIFYIQSLSVIWKKRVDNLGGSYKKGSKFYTFVVIMLEALGYPNSNPIALIEKALPRA